MASASLVNCRIPAWPGLRSKTIELDRYLPRRQQAQQRVSGPGWSPGFLRASRVADDTTSVQISIVIPSAPHLCVDSKAAGYQAIRD